MSGTFDRAELGAEMPFDLQAEQAILGGVMTNSRVYDDVCDVLEPRYFYSPLNRLIYETSERLIISGTEPNPIMLRQVLVGSPEVEAAGGWEKIAPIITGSLVGVMGNRRYAETVRDLWVRRQMLELSGDMREMVTRPDGRTAQDVVDHVEEAMLTISRDRSDIRTVGVSDSMASVLEAAQRASQIDGVIGTPTGYARFDAISGGLENGTLTILAGRPAMGKTAAGVGIAIRAAKATGKQVLYWSGEVSDRQISQRLLAAKTNIPVQCIRSGKNRGEEVGQGEYAPGTPLRQEQWDRIVSAQIDAAKIPLVINDTPAITVAKLYSVARRMARSKKGLTMVVVDYLALMRGSQTARKQGRYAEVSEISADLLAMAKSLNVPVIALQQLNRDVEKRDNKRPTGADLRDSGNLEQDASMIVLLYREEYYLAKEGLPEQKPGETMDKFMLRQEDYYRKLDASRGKAVWIVDKNRQGSTGDIPMLFNGPQTWFRDMSEGEESPAW